MARKFGLQSLLDLSNLRLDEATRRLGELIASEQEAAARLQLLVQYRDEYHARFLVAARAGIGQEAWRNFRSFLDRLDEAIVQARAMTAQSQQRKTSGQQDWLAKRGQVKAFDTLAHRHRVRENDAQRKREQKTLDEHAARGHAAKKGAED